MKRIAFRLLGSLMALCTFAPSLSAQEYVSLDAYTVINSIQFISPSGSYWNNPDGYSILIIDKNDDFSEVGGSKNNLAKFAVLFTKEQLSEIANGVKAKGTYFIAKIPIYQCFYLPALQKENDILDKIDGALFIHRLSLQKHPDTTPYEYCDSRSCPDSVGSHEIIGSFQITKSGGKYYLVTGMPMNSGGTPIPWNISEIKKAGGTGEIAIEMSASQYGQLF